MSEIREKIIEIIKLQNENLKRGFDLEDLSGPLADEIMPLVDTMLDALNFYADERSWQLVTFCEPPTSAIKADGGRRAREALKNGVET